jgi:PAS domain S-box-containing protein
MPRPGSTGAYVFALGCVIVATLIRLSFDPVLPEGAVPYISYFPALVFATLVAGTRAGTFALVTSAVLSWWFFLPPRQSFLISSSVDRANLIVFAVSGAIAIWGVHLYRRATEAQQITTKQLQTSEERLRLATQVSGLGILDYDVVADAVAVTPELYALAGLARDATIDLKMGIAIIHEEDRERIAKKIQQALDPRGPGELDEKFRVKRLDNGETRWVHVLSRTHFSGEGEERRPVRSSGVVVDITAYKAAEAQAERQRKELTHLMRVAALGGLAGGIAHEIRQPLASILANAQAARAILAQKNPDWEAEFGAILEDIIQDDTRADEVITRLGRLLKKEEPQRRPISLNELIMSTVRLLQSELIYRNVRVETELRNDLPIISGDPVELQQVLLNLFMNAMDAMTATPPSERRLTIGTRETKEGTAELSLRDQGPGISPDELTRIHEPFFTTKESGLGLGLSICSMIVDSHRGRLTLSNATDGGVIATVSLPTLALPATAS